MIIDAMDLLHSRRYEVFCLITSDADFTRLATRIREDGLTVVGIGRQRTPRAFIAACNQFTAIEALQAVALKTEKPALSAAATAQLELLHTEIATIYDDLEDGRKWTELGIVGSRMKLLDPGFDPRSFGCKTLAQLIKSTGRYQVKYQGGGSRCVIRPKQEGTAGEEPEEGAWASGASE